MDLSKVDLSHVTWPKVLASSAAAFVVFHVIRKQIHTHNLKLKVAKRREEREKNLEKMRHFVADMSEEEVETITSLSYNHIKEALQSGRYNCLSVLKAYISKSLKAHEKTNCICLFIDDCIERAKELDKQHDKASDLPLYGLPISIKECVKVKGMDTTLGYAQDVFKPADKNAVVVDQLIRMGAIPFVHTNVPLSLCSFGCSNSVYGATSNPFDSTRVPGGSSGGEGALIALNGSVFGIGTDIGGSVRIPSAFCGIVGFKPSLSRMSLTSNPGGVPGRQLVIAVEGPMAREIEACVDYCRVAWSDKKLYEEDAYLAPTYWNEQLFQSKEKLNIGYYTYDGYFQPAPAYQRAVLEAVDRLRSLGHTCVPFKVPDAERAFKLLAAAVSADGGYFLNNKLDKDLYDSNSDFGFVPRKVSLRIQRLLSKLVPWPRVTNLLSAMPRSCPELRQAFADILVYRHEFTQQMRVEHIDVLLCPPHCVYPPHHPVAAKILPTTTYTALFNLLDFPAGTTPITHVTEEDDLKLDEYPKADMFDKIIKQQCTGCVGLPISVQVAGLPYKEEQVLRVLQELAQNK